MNEKELRIGNLVYDAISKEFCKITANDILHLSEGMDCYVFNPITLNEEWLLKFGFENEKENHFNIGWFSIWKCNDMFLCDKNGVVVKTVHQLQNLYFALTRKELNY